MDKIQFFKDYLDILFEMENGSMSAEKAKRMSRKLYSMERTMSANGWYDEYKAWLRMEGMNLVQQKARELFREEA